MELDDDFFARVGHDLRGELATMLAGVHYLLRYEKRIEPGTREMLERVRGAGERLRRLLDEFDHAVWLRVDPRRPMAMAACDAVELVQSAAGRLEEAAAARGVRLVVERELGEAEAAIQGDAELLAVALDYVIGFAITRSRDLPVRVQVTARDGAPAAVVTDEGGSVPREGVERLLEPFAERAAISPDPIAPRRRDRLGLGLAIARGILEAHGGALQVELDPGGAGAAPAPPGPDPLPPDEPGGAAAEPGPPPSTPGGLRFTCTLGPSAQSEGHKPG